MSTQNLYSIKKNETTFENVSVKKSEDSYRCIRQYYSDDIEVYESMFVLLLNVRNETIGFAKISQGGCVGTVIDVKIIAKYAVDSLAHSVILAHNHPSGSLIPSEADRLMTHKIKTALSYLDVNVLDHLILTKDSYYSFADEGMM
jgi:DNA repair protein RadC